MIWEALSSYYISPEERIQIQKVQKSLSDVTSTELKKRNKSTNTSKKHNAKKDLAGCI